MKKQLTQSFGASLFAALTVSFLGTPGEMAHGQTIYVSSYSGGKIGEYTTSGGTVNASLISGISFPTGIAVSGNDMYVARWSINTGQALIGKYTTSGATLNASLISGLFYPESIAVSGNRLFLADLNSSNIAEYTTDGTLVNWSFISGISHPNCVAISGDNLFVADGGGHRIGEYTLSGATVNASLITGLDSPVGIAFSGNNIYVAQGNNNGFVGRIGEYTLDGATVNASLIVPTAGDPSSIAIYGDKLFLGDYGGGKIGEYNLDGTVVNAALFSKIEVTDMIIVPEPSSSMLAMLGLVLLFGSRLMRSARA